MHGLLSLYLEMRSDFWKYKKVFKLSDGSSVVETHVAGIFAEEANSSPILFPYLGDRRNC